jgi:hypothetical protein
LVAGNHAAAHACECGQHTCSSTSSSSAAAQCVVRCYREDNWKQGP